MNKPYFSEGEQVILQSIEYPEYNGEYVIYKILQPEEGFDCRINKDFYLIADNLCYVLDTPLSDKGKHDDVTEILWRESALRKKHQPGELSFNSLMSSLKSPIEA
jgi:hypothetical protein